MREGIIHKCNSIMDNFLFVVLDILILYWMNNISYLYKF